MSLLIKNARTKERKELVDILIENGKIAKIEPHISAQGEEIIDADGRLVSPSFVEPHCHLDGVMMGWDLPGRTETLTGALKLDREIRKRRTAADVKERGINHVKTLVTYGVTKMRAIATVATSGGLTGVEGVLAVKEECKDFMDMQVQAFPQDGVFVDPGTEDLLYKAMDMGADVIGGLPWFEYSRSEGERQVDLMFQIAKKYNADIDLHLDQAKDPLAEFLEYSALKTIKEGYQGRVTAAHCTSLAYQTYDHAQRVIQLVKRANMSICANPGPVVHMGIDPEPRTRGITRVRELLDAGVNVTTASDTVCDVSDLYGTGDPLDYGLLLAYLAQFNTLERAEQMLDMITYNAAKAMRLSNYGLGVGNNADLNIIDAPSASEALRLRPSRLYVIKNGKVIATTEKTSEIK